MDEIFYKRQLNEKNTHAKKLSYDPNGSTHAIQSKLELTSPEFFIFIGTANDIDKTQVQAGDRNAILLVISVLVCILSKLIPIYLSSIAILLPKLILRFTKILVFATNLDRLQIEKGLFQVDYSWYGNNHYCGSMSCTDLDSKCYLAY